MARKWLGSHCEGPGRMKFKLSLSNQLVVAFWIFHGFYCLGGGGNPGKFYELLVISISATPNTDIGKGSSLIIARYDDAIH